jgi:heat shock protein HtpX
MGISRSREYEADASGAHLCGDPLALASALAKVSDVSLRRPFYSANPALSSLYIVKPYSSLITSLFSTHPPIEERIARLRKMAQDPSA